MAVLRVCSCGAIVERTPCDGCKRERPRRRGTTSQRGYGAYWRKLSEQARRMQPYCSVPGCTGTDLTVDHIDPATRGQPGLTLADVQVLCRFHNSSKGAKRYRVEGSTTLETAALWVL